MAERKIDPKFNIYETYKTMNVINPYRFEGVQPDTYSYLLDNFPGAILAYSFRRLRSDYSGACIRVRRSSDNLETDITFNNNYISETALLNHVGSGDGFITKFYDQSLSSINWVNATPASQPQIVASGSIVKFGSFVNLSGLNNKTLIASGVSYGSNTITCYNVINHAATDPSYVSVIDTSSNYAMVGQNGAATTASNKAGSVDLYLNGIRNITPTRDSSFDLTVGTTLKLQRLYPISAANTWSHYNLNYDSSTTFQGLANNLERLVYPNDTNAAGIEANMNAYYTIY